MVWPSRAGRDPFEGDEVEEAGVAGEIERWRRVRVDESDAAGEIERRSGEIERRSDEIERRSGEIEGEIARLTRLARQASPAGRTAVAHDLLDDDDVLVVDYEDGDDDEDDGDGGEDDGGGGGSRAAAWRRGMERRLELELQKRQQAQQAQ